jgi:hypothetical protein
MFVIEVGVVLIFCVYMWNLSMVLRCGLFLWWCSICMTSCMGPKGCASSRRCCAKLEDDGFVVCFRVVCPYV